MSDLPTGMITFLLSDVEGSTLLWEQYPEQMGEALTRHDKIIEQVVVAHIGMVVRPRGEGDSRFAVFEQADKAVRAAWEIQQELAGAFSDLPLSIKVRMGIHTGAASLRVGDYYGTAVNRCARLRGLGHGGQTLLSEVTARLVQDTLPEGLHLVDMGSHHLKGLTRPEKVFQLWIPDLPNEFPPLQSADIVLNNLPEAATEFIGRKDEVENISALLRQQNVRLITLTGPGGAGKTRLCLATANNLLPHFTHGVFFVDLAPITDPALTATTIARAIGIREGGGRPPLDNLLDFLAGKEMLIVLDNFEQIITEAMIVSQLLASSHALRILVTSRIALSLRGEQEYPVPPLSLPDNEAALSIAQLLDYAAVNLFVDRARAIRPAFELTRENAAAVLGICRRLDGLPLAIEIAAARIRVLPPQAILKRLDQSLRLLVGGAADLPTRQQTLRSAIDWSYDLLDSEEKTLLARLSVFVGGFTLESAEGVCNTEGDFDILSGVETLVKNNLVRQVESVSDYPRFDMLLTIREYAHEKLEESGELLALCHSHASYFVQQAEANEDLLYGQQSTISLKQIDEEHDNYRAAIVYGLTHENYLDIAVRICAYIFWFWYRYGHFHEGREWSERVLKAAESWGGFPRAMAMPVASLMSMWEGDLGTAAQTALESVQAFETLSSDIGRANSHMSYGIILINQGKDKKGHPHLITASELFDQLGNEWFKATTLVHLANAALGLGQFDEALARLNQALPIVKAIKDPWQLGFCMNNYGEVARTQGAYDKAEEYYRMTEEYFREADAVGDHARLLYALAIIAQRKGHYEQAKILFHESLGDFRELGNKRGIAECLAGIAGLAAEQGAVSWAVILYSAAESLIAAHGAAWWPADRVEFERTVQLMKSSLPSAEFAALWTTGHSMSMDQAISYVMEDSNND